MYVCIYIYICMCIYIYIYIYEVLVEVQRVDALADVRGRHPEPVLYYAMLLYTSYFTMLYHTIPYYTIQCYTIYFTILYHTIT